MSTDDELLARLRHIADEIDAPPADVTEAAQAAFSTRELDDELAELLRDSERDLAGAAVRGPGPRLLSFETEQLSVELQVEVSGDRISVSGLVVGTDVEVAVEVQSTTTPPRPVPSDPHGWFRADDLPAEPFRVRVVASAGPAVTTGWIRP